MSDPTDDWFYVKAEIQEHRFRSSARIIGPLIVAFRTLWNSVATKWYVRPLIQQQNHFNRLLVQRLHDLDSRLIEQDREQTAQSHDLAEIAAQLRQTNRLLANIDRRLQDLERRENDESQEPRSP